MARGRPKKKVSERKSAQFSIRLTQDLKTKLEAAASENDTSLSREIEDRLKASFDNPSQLDFAGKDMTTRHFLLLVEFALRVLTKRTGAAWHIDRFTFDNARRAIDYLLDRLRPAGSPTVPGTMLTDTKLKGKELRLLEKKIADTDWGTLAAEHAAIWILDDDAEEQRAAAKLAIGRGLVLRGNGENMKVEVGPVDTKQQQTLERLDQIARYIKPKPNKRSSGEPPEYEP